MSDSRERAEISYEGRDLEAMAEARNYQRWIISALRPYLHGCVGEVGAGVGAYSAGILNLGVNHLVAFEPATNLFPSLQRQLSPYKNASAINGGLSGSSDIRPSQFDALVYLNVLEHIEADAAEVAEAYSALKPGGYLCILVPALQWLYSPFDRELGHYRRYAKSSLKKLVEGQGMRIVRVKYMDMLGALPWFVNFVLLKRTMTGGAVRLYDRVGVPLTRMFERFLPVPMGKNLFLVAEKPREGDN